MEKTLDNIIRTIFKYVPERTYHVFQLSNIKAMSSKQINKNNTDDQNIHKLAKKLI